MDNFIKFFGIILISLSVVAAGYIHGDFVYKSRQDDTIKVVGFASKNYNADVVKWTITIGRNVGISNLKDGYLGIDKDVQAAVQIINNELGKDAEIVIQPVNALPSYDQNGGISNYSVQQKIKITSKNMEKIEKLALNPVMISQKGIAINSSDFEYYISNLGDVKKELIAEATIDSLKRAEIIAKSANSKIGKMVSARTGVFQITEPYSNEVADYGIYSTESKAKEVKVTVSAVYQMN